MDDRRALGSRFQDCCRQTRSGGGLPETEEGEEGGIPAGITHDLVLQIDLPARRMEREERLLAFYGGDVNKTLMTICREGGGKDARFLLAHGVDANYLWGGWPMIRWAAHHGRVDVVEALLNAGAGELGESLSDGAGEGNTAVVALLLDRLANVHYSDDQALQFATMYGHLETATLLLQRGATARNRILAAAVHRGHHAVADLLRAHGAV